MKEFDLNIEKILESWEVYHAIREIIANALDEQMLTHTKSIQICQASDNCWHIIDFGRGLNYHHLTQNENEEKLTNERLIGRFGVGLKDALATLYRHDIRVSITSRYGVITLKQSAKIGFADLVTLHAVISETPDPNMVGTDFCLIGCTKQDIEKAKKLFLAFSDEEILETTEYGEVISRSPACSNIYINGVKVAEEPNFLFSYNITSLTKQLKKTLNRERSNVGRSAFTPRIKDILKKCKSERVIKSLVADLQRHSYGTSHDELTWNDIQLQVSFELQKASKNSSFVTAEEIGAAPSLLDEMKRSGITPVIVPSSLVERINERNRDVSEDQRIMTSIVYRQEERKKFVPTPVDICLLSDKERIIYDKMDSILQLIGGKPQNVNEITLVEKIYDSDLFLGGAVGLWQPQENNILIKRSQLANLRDFSGTLLHECAHALSDADDLSREFEKKLTALLGILAEKVLLNNESF
ncbi:MAG: hypothetical protein IJK35_07415 [Oscillospiraceae bacterium]|nr:hypothetical protein [Oscillospiraceae bacterium]